MGKKLIIILIAILVLGIAGVGIFTAMQLTNKPEPVATPLATQEPLPTLAPSPTPNLCLLEFSLGSATSTPISVISSPRSSATPASTAKASSSPLALGGLPTASPTIKPTSTTTSTATGSPRATATSSAIALSSPTAKPQASLPAAGVGLPTIIGIVMGLLLLIGAFFLAV